MRSAPHRFGLGKSLDARAGEPKNRRMLTHLGETAPPVTKTVLSPRELWPLAGLRVASGDLELRYVDDEILNELVAVALRGVHDPDAMPFVFPWTSGTPTEVGRRVMQYHWGLRGSMSPAEWSIDLAVVKAGRVVGAQGMVTKDFATTRTAETGSWLGREFQGQGIGKAMRVLMLHLGFDGFGASEMTSSAWADNAASNGLSAALGYESNGQKTFVRNGQATVTTFYRMDARTWKARPVTLRPEVTIEGLAPVLDQLNLA